MALLFCDSFDHYASADILKKWTQRSSYGHGIASGGRNSTNCAYPPYADPGWFSVTCLGGVSEAIVGVAVKLTVANPCNLIVFGSAGEWECGVQMLGDGTLQAFVGNQSGYTQPGGTSWSSLLGTPTTVALQTGVWAYLEVRMKCDGSTGTCVIRLNGVEVKNLTGLDTLLTSSSLTRVGLGTNWSVWSAFDDFVAMDLSGSHNNSFLGDVTVEANYPTADGTTIQGTPSAGSNYACVDEAQGSMTDYVTFDTVDETDTYTTEDVATGATVHAVQVVTMAKKSGVGGASIEAVIRQGGTNYDHGTPVAVGDTDAFQRFIYEHDPVAADWTPTTFNANEFGMKKAV